MTAAKQLEHPAEMAATNPAFVPYPGPRPFAGSDAAFFFGRDREQEEIVSLVLAHPVMLLLAQSGAGKTSLVNAKIVPKLLERGCEVFAQGRVGGEVPHEVALEQVSNVFAFNAMITLRRQGAAKQGNAAVVQEMEVPEMEAIQIALNNTLASLFGRGEWTAREDGPGGEAEGDDDPPPPRVLIIDQFEEIFTSYPSRWQEREKFFQQVAALFRSDRNLRILFAMREEFVSGVGTYSGLVPERMRTSYRLQGLTEHAALQSIKAPALVAGRAFGPGAAEKLVKSLQQMPGFDERGERVFEYIEPLHLQLVCRNLWQSLPAGTQEISAEMIGGAGDIEQALSRYFEECLLETVESTSVDERRLRRWFGEKLILKDGTRNLLYQDKENTSGLPNRAVKRLDEKHHLLRSELRGASRWYELSHDRFAGPIRRSYEQWRRRNDVLGKQLEDAAGRWREGDKRTDYLWTGTALQAAERWLKGEGADSAEEVKEFVRAARRRRQRYHRMSLAVAAITVIIGILVSAWAWDASDRLRATNLELEAAHRQRKLNEEQMRRSAGRRDYAQTVLHSGDPRARAFAMRPLVSALAFYNGNIAAASDLVELLLSPRLWARPLSPPLRIGSPGSAFLAASFAPASSGQAVVAIMNSGELMTWRQDGWFRVRLAGKDDAPHEGPVLSNGCSFSDDGRYLLLVITPPPVEKDKTRRPGIQVSHEPPASPSAKMFEWRGDSYQAIETNVKLTISANRFVTWSPDGNLLAITSVSSRFDTFKTQILEIDSTGCRPLEEKLRMPDEEEIVAVCFSPDNMEAATASNGNTIRWWRRSGTNGQTLEPSERAPRTLSFDARINGLTFGPGKEEVTVMAWNEKPRIISSDVEVPERSISLISALDTFQRYFQSPIRDGRQLAAVTMFGRVCVAPVDALDKPNPYSEPICFPGTTCTSRFSVDGKRLLILSGGSWNAMDTIQSWDISHFWNHSEREENDSQSVFVQDPPEPWLSELAEAVSGGPEFGPEEFPTFAGMIGKNPPVKMSDAYRRIWERYFTEGLPAGPVPR